MLLFALISEVWIVPLIPARSRLCPALFPQISGATVPMAYPKGGEQSCTRLVHVPLLYVIRDRHGPKPHSFERIANGHTLATYQFNGAPDKQAGALVELDDKGHAVRTSDASDSEVERFIRPYSLQVLPKLDRVVTSSADMLPNEESSHVVQVWRLSDLKLLKTVALPKAPHFKDPDASFAKVSFRV